VKRMSSLRSFRVWYSNGQLYIIRHASYKQPTKCTASPKDPAQTGSITLMSMLFAILQVV
jgi:hypothetical protein